MPKIIEELVAARQSERQLRVIDHDQDGSMELKKREDASKVSGLLRICTLAAWMTGRARSSGGCCTMRRRCMRTRCTRFARRRGTAASGRSIFRCSPTDSRRSASRGSRSTSRTRYFATARRKFILADTPGHEHTRNMATGASGRSRNPARRRGTRRAAAIATRIANRGLLGIEEFVLAVNKMDLVDFSRDVFEDIRRNSRRSSAMSDATPCRSARFMATTSRR